MKKLSYKHITDWLIQAGFLKLVTGNDGKTVRRPTDNGINIGISTEEREGSKGPYMAVIYNRLAQEFILDNLDAIISLIQK